MNYALKKDKPAILVGNRIPKEFFITKGKGESDLTTHAGSFHIALYNAKIERCNIMTYSSILPGIARQVPRTKKTLESLVHGSVMETIMACANTDNYDRVTAGIVFGWLYDKKTSARYGGLVCEYSGNEKEKPVKELLRKNIQELYSHLYGKSGEFDLDIEKTITKSFVPKKKYGTALVALCFLNFEVPYLGSCDERPKKNRQKDIENIILHFPKSLPKRIIDLSSPKPNKAKKRLPFFDCS